MKHRSDIADELRDEEDRLNESFLPLADLFVPKKLMLADGKLILDEEVEMSDGSHNRTLGYAEENCETRPAKKEMIWDFLRLEISSDADILRFAQKYGLLGLCKHGLPAGHIPPPVSFQAPPRVQRVSLTKFFPNDDWCVAEPEERLSEWRLYSRYLATLLRIATALHGGSADALPAEDVLWDLLKPEQEKSERWREAHGSTISEQREFLAQLVNRAVVATRVIPVFTWPDDEENEPWIQFGSSQRSTLLPLLVFETASLISKKNFAICGDCFVIYSPGRRPSKGRRNRCEKCRNNSAERVRKYRLKSRRSRHGKTRTK